jgi:hypothetical protein
MHRTRRSRMKKMQRRAESIFLYLLSAAIHHSFVVPALETSSAAAAADPKKCIV